MMILEIQSKDRYLEETSVLAIDYYRKGKEDGYLVDWCFY